MYLFSRRINLGPIEKDISISEAETQMIDQFSKSIEMEDIGVFWQLTLKTIDDLRIVGNENLLLEMYVMQLIYIKKIDIKNEISDGEETRLNNSDNISERVVDDINPETNLSNKIKSQLKNIDQVKTNPIKNLQNETLKSKIEIKSFQDLIEKATKEKEIELKYDLERNVKLVNFFKGKINISFNEKLNKNFIKNLSEKLLLWTGERWIISLSKDIEAKSMYEKKQETKNNLIEEHKKSKIAKEIKNAFPDAKLVDIKEEN